ncbi:MAG TPA: AGE family epimerase/isomerase [Candidatus Hydrogenedentes bacterium]|nr:AGE family epimerase/isomerase [Candidatus Hydrogenedentota bacterium]HOS01580.1 AGE family epimerase/isomerase [Candidatus Hydrogenedentota bacterium]
MANATARCERWLQEVQGHLRDELLPFWLTHGVDAEYGGYLTYLDRNGQPTGETVKTLLCQARMIYTYSSAHRAGFGDGQCLDIARGGVDFALKHFWDDRHWGWFWTCQRDGAPLNESKLTYGHAFMIYALSEYGMASGDHRGLEWAIRTYETLQTLAADNCRGGYYEFLERDWSKKKPGKYGGDRKSFDVHMHLMECMTNLYEATGLRVYRERTVELITLIVDRILHPESGLGQAQFAYDWTPLRQILFADVWGADRDVNDDEGRPLDNTSFGHNVEFAWLLLHAINMLDLDVETYTPGLKKIFDHCVTYGIDWERGGVFCEGPHHGPARERNKEFWQQAETLVGLLDAYLLFGDETYLDAYENVHRFVMDRMIHHEVGEWFPLFDEKNTLLWDYMAHAWKINYHTVRSMIQSEARLLKICG